LGQDLDRARLLRAGGKAGELVEHSIQRNSPLECAVRYVALACDYDGTLATNGRVGDDAVAALDRVPGSNRKLILVTGRELDDLQRVFPRLDLFDRVVVENGALLYRPANREEEILSERPPEAFVTALRARGVQPLAVGRVIVATTHPNEAAVLEVIRELGLELQVIFNKGSVMVLPPSVNKASGLHAALSELGLSAHNAVSVGDAENDHALLGLCECGVAVANALPLLKERADFVTASDHGAGVIELIDRLLADDLRSLKLRPGRHQILLGKREDGHEVSLPAYGPTILCAGPSESGKSTIATGFVERLAERGYQFCLIDPEGDYEAFAGAVVLGDHQRPPSAEEVLQLLADPDQSVIVNLLGVRLIERPGYLAGLLPGLQDLRNTVGRPHWIVVDEAHHVFPSEWDVSRFVQLQKLESMILVTVEPDRLAGSVLQAVDTLIAVGENADATIRAFASTIGAPVPCLPVASPGGNALVWLRHTDLPPFLVTTVPPHAEHQRHRRKYAQGDLGAGDSFFFRGPDGRLHLRAQNLTLFIQLADGVDDATWLYHLRRGDYSRWFRAAIKDKSLADAAASIEQDRALSAAESRARICAAIEERYTLPA
jgi:HAD superfamily hydrolase (TIGR01484 family)